MWMCVSESSKEDLDSSVVFEMLVDVGIPWKGDFCLVSELLPRFYWLKCWTFLHYEGGLKQNGLGTHSKTPLSSYTLILFSPCTV